MNKVSKLLAMTVLVMVFSLAFLGNGMAAQTWKLAHVCVAEPDNPYHATSLKFKELVEKGTEGRLKIQIFPQRQLGNDREILEGIQGGIIDASAATLGPVSAFEPTGDLLELPFLFRNTNHLDAVLDGPIGREILNKLDTAGFKALAFFDDGINNTTNSKHPIKGVADYKGLQMRCIEAPVRIATTKALGANPIPIAYSELYTALQTGVVDGQSNPNWVITARSLWEVQKYISITQHIWGGAVLLVNLDKFQKLSKEDQNVVMDAGIAASQYGRKLGRDSEEKHLQTAIDHKMVVERNPDLTSMRKATESVYTDVYAKHPDWKPIIEQIKTLGEKF